MFRAFLVGLLLLPMAALAQAPLAHHFVELQVDSGDIRNRGGERTVTFSQTLRVEGATWLRLYFTEASLGLVAGRPRASVLRLTSLLDGAVQEHDWQSLRQWRQSSAFFNGDAVRVELVADPDAPASRLRIHEVMVGEPALFGSKTICGALDDRLLSNDQRVARIVPVGCTAWLIDDAEGCFLTAGHCVGDNFDVIEFNVPLSAADGSVNHPQPSDQYAIDQSSLQWDQTVIGNDWAYFGGFPNSETELTPREVQGVTYTLGTPPAVVGSESIQITGYGSTTGTQGTPLTWDQVLTTHSGPLSSVSGTVLRYRTDTTGGDSVRRCLI